MDIKSILTNYRHIAIVGLSDKHDRPSHAIARHLMHEGYTIYPVNPSISTVLGLECWPSLLAIPAEKSRLIEIVVIFRKPQDVPPIVDEAIAIGAKVVWMQLGITNEAAAEKARNAGLDVVQNRCISVEHQRLEL
ncbi:CoA-binding domain protein [Chlorobaculum parvum NCIB 8327]|uniref:CoA-binding domain protein n=1 Tax=Chlorobaculum parvum (strain DSM 263 / NCIMB 8327) TaxID=517417 RepID=B3QMS5_CHLP8|nr:CoA-binding protein [Chlorobaculum parvum]ACF11228.1 CoA-binding domain protein [Chlorobaculum parvum NCIB 8327]